MNKKLKWIGMMLILTAILVGCNGTERTQENTTDLVTITLSTNPIIPVVGKTELILEIQDDEGQPLTDAKVEVSADHSDMSGMTLTGFASEQEDGKYAIDAEFSMSGNWKVTVMVQKESLNIAKDFELTIP
jgi:hypothetical protein